MADPNVSEDELDQDGKFQKRDGKISMICSLWKTTELTMQYLFFIGHNLLQADFAGKNETMVDDNGG